jgi:succinate dehydrogenase / fumarate reductase membrane anchor subunit
MSARLRDPLAVARGLGSAKDGTGHWWTQRLTAVALLLLTPWFAWLVLGLVGADQATMRATLAQPWTASLLLAFVVSLFWHAQLGMQVIVEDYVHDEKWKLFTLMANTFFSFAVGLAAVFAILKLSFGL